MSTNISFVIPAFNEEKEIVETLKSIIQSIGCTSFEIIVADNLSTDRTKDICEELGALVIQSDARTIAGVRNDGASHAKGSFLVFVDADISLGPSWEQEFALLTEHRDSSSRVIFGSKCRTPFSDFVSKGWYSPIQQRPSGYINSGHIVVPSDLFRDLNGFSSHLTTSEDVDICFRAARLGCEILHTPSLIAYHRGFPQSILGFTKREIWHGYQDVTNFRSFLSSTTAIFCITSMTMIILLLFLFLLTCESLFLVSAFIFFFAVSFLLYAKKIGLTLKSLIYWPIGGAYIIGRFLSLLRRVYTKKHSSPRAKIENR